MWPWIEGPIGQPAATLEVALVLSVILTVILMLASLLPPVLASVLEESQFAARKRHNATGLPFERAIACANVQAGSNSACSWLAV